MRGFTAIELLVAIAIVALITTLTLIDFRSATRRVRLELEAQKIALEIRRAQSLAAHAQQFAGTAPCGYGLYFDPLVSPGPGSFIIFAELTSLLGGCSEPFSYVSETTAVDADGTVEQVRLNEDVQITALSQPRLTVFFLTPAPTTS
ncbi:MAG: prepilin-type N-terminal cleavage/methylation domain-containing protein, partial [Patescibacteria group bacterium]|nr:prepilin-type N-terminal cleavage/methylation domain-containing protein [Patescibacteria group bacterium]